MKKLSMFKQSFENYNFPPFIKSILVVFNADMLSKVIVAFTEILLIRGLTKSDYGYFTIFITTMTFFGSIISNGINLKLVSIASKNNPCENHTPLDIFQASLLFQVLLFIIFAIILNSYSTTVSIWLFSNSGYGNTLFLGYLCSLGYIFFQIARSYYQANEQFVLYGRSLNVKKVLLCVGVLILFKLNMIHLHSVEYVYILVEYLYGAALLLISINIFEKILKINIKNFSKLYLQGSSLFFYYLFLSITERLGVIFLTRYYPAETVAEYGVASKFFMILMMTMPPIYAVLMPKLSKIEFDIQDSHKLFLRRWVKFTWWTIGPILLLSTIAKYVLPLISGENYIQSINIFRILSIAYFFVLIFAPATSILIIKNDEKYLVFVSIITLVSTYIGLAIFVPIYGAAACALWTTFSYLCINALLFIRAQSSYYNAIPKTS